MSSETLFEVRSEVRVHVRLGTMRLDYHGAREFYERHVEALVASAASRGGGVTVSTAPGASGGATPIEPAPAVPAPTVEARGAQGGAYEPSSPEFGRYLRRLGPDADAPDRHVVAFAFYLWNYERMETFGFNEIEGCLHAIGRTLPEDAPAVFEDLTEHKRFLEAAGERRWRLTKKGENYVKSRLLTL